MARATDDPQEREAATRAAAEITAAKPLPGAADIKARIKAIHDLRAGQR